MAKEPDYDEHDMSTPTKVDQEAQYPNNETPTKGKRDKRELRPVRDYDSDDPPAEEMWRGGNFKYPPSWTMFEKMSKEEARYQNGAPFHNCGKCGFYSGNQCKVVRGFISPSMGCVYFQEKYGAMTFQAVPLRMRLK